MLLTLEEQREIQAYRMELIRDILEWQTKNQFTAEELRMKGTKVLERIHDNVD